MKKLLALIAFLPLIIIGCGKETITDEEKLSLKVSQEGWFNSLGQTPIGAPAAAQKKGGPIAVWRTGGKDSVDYTVEISGPGEATIPIYVRWYDTLIVVYSNPIDTVRKPTPYFHGNFSFSYKAVDNEWTLYGLTPAEIKSDSADGYVQIDSIQVCVIGEGARPTITSPTQFIAAANYPYIFNVGDSIKITVYKSGMLSDTVAWVLLHAPLDDAVSNDGVFNYVSPGVWTGTWVPNALQKHWAWVDVFDMGVITDKTQMTERTRLWGLPYKVE